MKTYWLELATTGPDAHKDAVLEMVVAEAEFEDSLNASLVHKSVMWVHPEVIIDFHPDVVAKHTKNGLFKECINESALDLFEAEDQLLKFVEQGILAGSNVNSVHAFMKVHMPKLNKRMLQVHYDVSALEVVCRSKGMEELTFVTDHRAESCIKESIAHAKACETWLRENLKS